VFCVGENGKPNVIRIYNKILYEYKKGLDITVKCDYRLCNVLIGSPQPIIDYYVKTDSDQFYSGKKSSETTKTKE